MFLHAVNFHIGGEIGGGLLRSNAKMLEKAEPPAKPDASPAPSGNESEELAAEVDTTEKATQAIVEAQENAEYHPTSVPQGTWSLYGGISHHFNPRIFLQFNILGGTWHGVEKSDERLNLKAFFGGEFIFGRNFASKFYAGLLLGAQQTWMHKAPYKAAQGSDSQNFTYPTFSFGGIVGWRFHKHVTWNILKIQGLYGLEQTKESSIEFKAYATPEKRNMHISLTQLKITKGIEAVI